VSAPSPAVSLMGLYPYCTTCRATCRPGKKEDNWADAAEGSVTLGGGWEALRAAGMTAVDPAGMQGLRAGDITSVLLLLLLLLLLLMMLPPCCCC